MDNSDDISRTSEAPTLDEATAYAELGRIVFADHSLTEIVGKVASLAQQVLPAAPEVSVTLIEGTRPHTAAFTGSLAVQLDERQYEAGFGPCLDAAYSGETIKLAMADPHSLYPDFRRVAQRRGVTSTLSVGLPVAARTVGALNIYNSTTEPFSAESDRIAATFAGFAGILLANIALYHDAADLAGQLQIAIKTRSVIEQAKGIIIADQHCTSDEAFKILVGLSQRSNMKLNVVAQALVDRTMRSQPDPRSSR